MVIKRKNKRKARVKINISLQQTIKSPSKNFHQINQSNLGQHQSSNIDSHYQMEKKLKTLKFFFPVLLLTSPHRQKKDKYEIFHFRLENA